MPKHRIEWSQQEQDKLFKAAEDLWEKNPEKTPHGLVDLAQGTILEEHRRRKYINGLSQLPRPLRERLLKVGVGKVNTRSARVIQLQIEELTADRDRIAYELAHIQSSAQQMAAEITSLRLAVKAIPSESQVLKNFLADILTEVQSRGRAIPGGPPKVSPVEVAQTILATKHNPEPHLSSAPKLPKILVCGLMAYQGVPIQNDFQDRCKITFWYGEKANHGSAEYNQLRAIAKHSDLIIALTDRMDHLSVTICKQEANDRLVQTQGRASEVRDQLRNWFSKQVD